MAGEVPDAEAFEQLSFVYSNSNETVLSPVRVLPTAIPCAGVV